MTGNISYDKEDKRHNISIPYSAKLLIQELETMSISSKILTPQIIDNKEVFAHINNVELPKYKKYVPKENKKEATDKKPDTPKKPDTSKKPDTPKKPDKRPNIPEKGIQKFLGQTAMKMIENSGGLHGVPI